MGNISPFFFILSHHFFPPLAFSIIFSGLIFTISLCAGPNKRVFWCILEKWELEQAFEVPLCLWIIGRLYSHYRAARFNAGLNSGSAFVCVEIRPWGNGCCCWPWTKPRKNRLVLEPVCVGEAQREFCVLFYLFHFVYLCLSRLNRFRIILNAIYSVSPSKWSLFSMTFLFLLQISAT